MTIIPHLRTPLSRLTSLAAVAALTISATLLASPLARAQDEPAAQPPPPPQPVITFEHAGLERLFPDSRDAGLVRALSMLGPRLKEIKNHPAMDDDLHEVPDEAVDLADTLLTSPMRMAVTLGGVDPQTQVPRFGVVLSFDLDNHAQANALDRDVEHLRALTGMQINPEPSQRWDGMHDLTLPFGVLTYGPREADDGWRYEMIFGAVDDPDDVATYLPTSKRFHDPAARGSLDLAALTPVSEMFGGMLAMFAPQGPALMQQLRDQGMVGPEAMAIEMTAGHTKTNTVKQFVVRRAGRYAKALRISTAPLTPQDLAIVPADATFAQVRNAELKAVWADMRKQIEQMGEPGKVDEFLAEFKAHTGVDLEDDLIATLADTTAFYISDSTGGGSFLSAVLAIQLADPQRMQASLATLADKANQAAAGLDLGPGALRLETSRHHTATMTTLRLRGLPLPVDPSIAIAGDWLVIGASQQAASAAAHQILSPSKGITANRAFAAAWPKGVDVTSIDFVDTPRTLRSGYATLSLLTSALANFVTSPDPGARDPGPILPTYAALTENAQPMITFAHWHNDDLIMEVHADRSMLVNAAGVLGVGEAGSLVMGALLGGGITAAAMESNSGTWMQQHQHHEEHEHGHDADEDDVAY